MDKLNNLKKKKTAFLICSLLTISVVMAAQLNWYNIGNMTGTIKKNELTIVQASLNLGSINSGANFVVTDDLILNVPVSESGGLNATKFFLIVPVSGFSDARQYLLERFAEFYLNITVSNITFSSTVVSNGEALEYDYLGNGKYTGWDHEDSDYSLDLSWWSCYDWNSSTFLPVGENTMTITAYGRIGAPNIDLSIDLAFSIELS